LAAHLDMHTPAAGAIEFAEEDTLPSTEMDRATFYEHLFAAADN